LVGRICCGRFDMAVVLFDLFVGVILSTVLGLCPVMK